MSNPQQTTVNANNLHLLHLSALSRNHNQLKLAHSQHLYKLNHLHRRVQNPHLLVNHNVLNKLLNKSAQPPILVKKESTISEATRTGLYHLRFLSVQNQNPSHSSNSSALSMLLQSR